MEHTTMGERIKHYRKARGLTQEQLAQRLGVSPQAVSKWENNLSCPDISILPELAALLGISTDQLLGRQTATVAEAQPLEQKEEKKGFYWEWEAPQRKRYSIIFAVFVLLYGALLLTNHVVQTEVSWWTLLWTLGLCFVGVCGLATKISAFPIALILTGGVFLLDAYGLWAFEMNFSILIAAMIIFWGICLLLDLFLGKKKTVKHIHSEKLGQCEYSCKDGYLSCEMSFGEHRAAVVTPFLRGGSIESSFGSHLVDFSGCQAVAENCTVEVEQSFGSLTLLIPDRFTFRVEKDESFTSAFSTSGAPRPDADGVICLKVENSFGSLQIRYI